MDRRIGRRTDRRITDSTQGVPAALEGAGLSVQVIILIEDNVRFYSSYLPQVTTRGLSSLLGASAARR